MTRRKTVKIEELIDKANEFFLQSHDDCKLEREGIQGFIGHILYETGNYKGFRYLEPCDMAASSQGTTYGMQLMPGGPVFFDKSRINFYK